MLQNVFQRIIPLALIIGVAYWYWSGPYQDKINPSHEAILEQNDKEMGECIRAAAYQHGATGTGLGSSAARQHCAQENNMYESDGHWHSYDMVRPD